MELLIVLILGLALLIAILIVLLEVAFGVLGFVIAAPFELLGALLQLGVGVAKLALGLGVLAAVMMAVPSLAVLAFLAWGAAVSSLESSCW